MKKSILLAFAILSCISAWADKYYSQVTVKAETGKGVVYVSQTEGEPDESAYKESMTSPKFESDAETTTAYIYARPLVEGEVLKYWIDADNNQITGNQISIKGSKDSNSPLSYTYTAVFGAPSAVTVLSNNETLGSATIDKLDNKIGDKVTITAAKIRVRNSEMGAHYSKAHKFEGWYDKDGNLVSRDLKYTFTITESNSYTARFSLGKMITGPGYYRIRWFGHDTKGKEEFMTLLGAYNPVTGSNLSNRYLAGVLQYTTSFSNPANVMKVDGTFKDIDNTLGEQTVMTDVVLTAQDKSTKAVLPNYSLSIGTAHNPGYYKILCSSLVIASWSHGASMSEGGATLFITRNKPTDDINDPNSYYDFEPIDLEHVDEFYFGAEPAEEMNHDGGYWTSMYTSFPYQCYGPDGVEAYYISEIRQAQGVNIAVLTKIENGIVPANTAVLLKCNGLTTIENRLIPLMEDPEPITDNLLHGEFQLNQSKDNPDHKVYDDASMRVFGANADGEVGFYRLAEGTELAANRAWIDISGLADAPVAKIVIRNHPSGIDDISAAEGSDAEPVIYDLHGRRVTEPAKGQVYIINGSKRLY